MPFFQTMQHATTTERNTLLNVPFIRSALCGEFMTHQYMAFLCQAYHHVKYTVPLLMACGSRLDNAHHWLRLAIAEYIEEEVGHEEWILSDITACGSDAKFVRQSTPHFTTEMMVAYAYHQIDRGNPVGFFGMVYVLEGTSVSIATDAANTIQAALALLDKAFSYLNSHGALDMEHVKFFEGSMNRLTDEQDQAAVMHYAQQIYRLYADIFRHLPNKASSPTSRISHVQA